MVMEWKWSVEVEVEREWKWKVDASVMRPSAEAEMAGKVAAIMRR